MLTKYSFEIKGQGFAMFRVKFISIIVCTEVRGAYYIV